jgi:hypothetical protein
MAQYSTKLGNGKPETPSGEIVPNIYEEVIFKGY